MKDKNKPVKSEVTLTRDINKPVKAAKTPTPKNLIVEEVETEEVHLVGGEMLTEDEVKRRARTEVIRVLDNRIEEYTNMLPEFDDMIESYRVLIDLVKSNKNRFKPVRHVMIVEQFNAAVDSYKTQRSNFAKELKKYKKLRSSEAMHSTADLIKRLELNSDVMG